MRNDEKAKEEGENQNGAVKNCEWTVDRLLDVLGSPGKCQVIVYIALSFHMYQVPLNFIAMSLYGAPPNQTCKLPEDWLMNMSIPKKIDGSYENCLMYKDPTNPSLGTQHCINGYEYHLANGRYPITAQWDLVCDDVYLVRLVQSIFFTGVMVGGLIFGYLGDYFGRRPIILLTLYCQASFGIILSFSPYLIMFATFKFFQGMMLQGLQTTNAAAVMELYQTRYRTRAGMVLAIFVTSSSLTIGLMSYVLPQWNYMQLAFTVPAVISISSIWILPESLRWLLSKQKLKEANKVCKYYAKFNKVLIPVDLDNAFDKISQKISNDSQQSVNKNIIDIFRIPSVRRSSFILFYLWFTASVVYYGITSSNTFLRGNPSLNFVIVGTLEIISRFAGYFIIDKFGRRIPIAVAYAISGVMCIASGCIGNLVHSNEDSTLKIITIVLALIGRVAMGQCLAFITIMTYEIFPTVLRTVGSGTCAVWARIGGMIAPFALLLDTYAGKAVPFILFGSLAVVAGGLGLLLPETLNVPLPDTVKDMDNAHIKKNETDSAQGHVNLAMDVLSINDEQTEKKFLKDIAYIKTD